MDVERTMEFILQCQAQAEVRQAKADERQAAADASHADTRKRMDIAERQIAATAALVREGMKIAQKLLADRREVNLEMKRGREDMSVLHDEIRETNRIVTELGKTVDRFVRSMNGRRTNGHNSQ